MGKYVISSMITVVVLFSIAIFETKLSVDIGVLVLYFMTIVLALLLKFPMRKKQ